MALAAVWGNLADQWLQNPWLLWGAGPLIATNLGFWLTASLLELLIASGWCDNHLICYASSRNTPRKQLLAETHKRVPWRDQLWDCICLLVGPIGWVSGALLAGLMQLIQVRSSSWLPATAAEGALQFLAYMVLTDFGLYWGHRVQHEVGFLWRLHSKHHSIDTPTPYSAVFIDPLDATLQVVVPLVLASAIIRPAPLVAYAFAAFGLAENAINHAGIDHWLFNLLTLKALPFRATTAFHDTHHKYSCHLKNAKNYAERFWVWDWLFDTTSPISGRALAGIKSKPT